MTEQNAKYWKYGIGAAAVLGLIYVATRPNQGGSETDPTSGNNDPNFDAYGVAMDLVDTMATTGTDEEDILDILKFITPAQFNLVFQKFGKRQYNPTLGNQINPLAWFTELDYYDLKFWLKNELSASEYNVLKAKYPQKL